MIDFEIDIKGLDELNENLRQLGAEMGAKTLRSALREAGKPMLAHMQANAPEAPEPRLIKTYKGERIQAEPGYLRSRLKMRARLNNKGRQNRRFGKDSVAIVQVGAFGAYYAKFIEYGTVHPRPQGGYTKANPFIRSAQDVAGESIAIFRRRLARKIVLAERRLKRSARSGN